MSSEATGVWLYAIVVRDGADERVRGLRGVADEPVRAVEGGDLAAVVGTVPLADFGQDALRRNLEDLDWLAAKAWAHDAVITAVARSGPVIPVRMTTVYLTHDRVGDLLTGRRAEFHAALARVTGRVELGVRACADTKALVPQEDPVTERSGTAYLLRRKRALEHRELAHGAAAAAAERIHTLLLRCATDGKRKPVADNRLSERARWTVLNGTYLVDDVRVAEFRALVDELARDTAGIELEITGPWPPYSFAGDVVSG